jgi:hypothetical protein
MRRDAMRQAIRRGITRRELSGATDVELALDLLTGPMLWRSLMSGEPIDEPFTCGIVRAVVRAFPP